MWRCMVLSFTIQAAAISIGIIVSVLTVHKLDAVALPQPMPPYPRAPKPIKLVDTPQRASSRAVIATHRSAEPFVVPTRVPIGVPVIHDGPEMMLTQEPALLGSGSPDGIPGAGDIPGISRMPTIAVAAPREKGKEILSETKRLSVGGNVMEAKIMKRVMPVYPPLARQARISGTVRLEGVISREGRVANLQVHSGHPLLIAAAVDAVRQWVYRPTLLNGQAVEVIAPIEVHFTLSQ
jgi:periplasmic protein TonB